MRELEHAPSHHLGLRVAEHLAPAIVHQRQASGRIRLDDPCGRLVQDAAEARLALAECLVGLLTLRHVARHREQMHWLAVRIKNGRNRHVPPPGLAT